jgi:uncharacterized protein YlxW (UPF0749 family)
MAKTNDILNELKHLRNVQGKLFDEIKDVRKEVNKNHLEVTKTIGRIETKVEVHKVKSGFIGVIGGAIPTALALAFLLFKQWLIGGGK